MRRLTLFTMFLIIISLISCDYGLIGKKTAAKVDSLGNTLDGVVGKARDSVMGYLVKTRDDLLDYLRNSSTKEAHDLSLGIMQGVIGYLDSAGNRDGLANLLDSVITHATGAVRVQLIQFKNGLLDPTFRAQLDATLHGIMHELILNPADNLLTLILSDKTRNQLSKLLQIVIPAVLNDSAITQVGKLRNVLLGANMKKDIASWVDTAMVVLDSQLKHNLKPTIHDIVDDNTSTVRKDAGWIITGMGILAVVVGFVIYYVQRKKVKLNQDMLHQVALQIEQMKKTAPEHYEALTGNIKEAMQAKDLEADMSSFLAEKHIH